MSEMAAIKYADPLNDEQSSTLDRFTEMMTRAPEAITVLDPNVQGAPILFANKRFLMLTRYKAEEVKGRNFGFLRGVRNERAGVEGRWRRRQEFSACLPTHRGDGTAFVNFLNVYFVDLPGCAPIAVACHIPFVGPVADRMAAPAGREAWSARPPEAKSAGRPATAPPTSMRMRARAVEMFVGACAQVVTVENARMSVAETRRQIEGRRVFAVSDATGDHAPARPRSMRSIPGPL